MTKRELALILFTVAVFVFLAVQSRRPRAAPQSAPRPVGGSTGGHPLTFATWDQQCMDGRCLYFIETEWGRCVAYSGGGIDCDWKDPGSG